MAQTRPSAIVRRPDPETPISEATVAELLTEALERASATRSALADSQQSLVAYDPDLRSARMRELSIFVTLVEDAITRHNKAVYMERGVFAITDAERLPVEPTRSHRVVQDGPVAAPSRVAVVAATSAEAKSAARDCCLEEGWVMVLNHDHVLGNHFDQVVYADGYDRGRTTEESLRLRSALEAAMRP